MDELAYRGLPAWDSVGHMRLIAALIDGHWDPAEFLVVPPGQQTVGVYDWDEVVRAKPV